MKSIEEIKKNLNHMITIMEDKLDVDLQKKLLSDTAFFNDISELTFKNFNNDKILVDYLFKDSPEQTPSNHRKIALEHMFETFSSDQQERAIEHLEEKGFEGVEPQKIPHYVEVLMGATNEDKAVFLSGITAIGAENMTPKALNNIFNQELYDASNPRNEVPRNTFTKFASNPEIQSLLKRGIQEKNFSYDEAKLKSILTQKLQFWDGQAEKASKEKSPLRAETTKNNANDFRAYAKTFDDLFNLKLPLKLTETISFKPPTL